MGAPKYVLNDLVLKAGPVVWAPAVEQRRKDTHRTAEQWNRDMAYTRVNLRDPLDRTRSIAVGTIKRS
jgi:hypothetical protein